MLITLVLPDIPTEDQLLRQARSGDQRAIMQIYESYFTPVYEYIRLRTGDIMSAEDLTSEVFIRLIKALKGPNAPRKTLRGWLFRVARNTVYDHYGQKRKMPQVTLDEWISAPGDDQPEVQFIQNMDLEHARHALRMLAADQQEVLILRFGQSLSLQETADVMGKSVSAIKSLQFRAVDTLRNILVSGSGSHRDVS